MADGHVRHADPAPDLRLQDAADHDDEHGAARRGARSRSSAVASSSCCGSAAPSWASASPACSRGSTTPSPTRTWPASSSPGGSDLNDQERLAVEFLDLLSADHHAIDDEFYRRLGEHFTAAQIIELGFACANSMGLHRFIHTLDVFGRVAAGHPLQRRPGRLGHRRARSARRTVSQTVLVTGATGPGRRQHLQAAGRAGRPRARAGPGDRGHRAARRARRRGGHGRRHRRRRGAAGGARAATPPSTAPRCSAEPARTWPTSRRSTSAAPRTCSTPPRPSTWAGWWP